MILKTNILSSPRDEPAVDCPELDFCQNSQGPSIWTKQPFLYIQQAFLTRHMSIHSREEEQVTPLRLMKHFYCQYTAMSSTYVAHSSCEANLSVNSSFFHPTDLVFFNESFHAFRQRAPGPNTQKLHTLILQVYIQKCSIISSTIVRSPAKCSAFVHLKKNVII